ncbi:MAG: type II secretion system GspH family protein [Planctomycetes bacterium]|nr:type II secretion system GspH family protein [Planctomycetota bacterium]
MRSYAVGRLRGRTPGFSLIELLVVVGIIGVLAGLIMPALSIARDRAKVGVCRARLNQLGLAITLYADQHDERIPRGPACTGPFDFTCAQVATNQLWIGRLIAAHPDESNGLGVLLEQHEDAVEMFFCPDDDTGNHEEELPRIGTALDAYGSYMYRQLDQLPPLGSQGTLSRLGTNTVDDVKVPVEALALDTNSLGPGPLRHTNHAGARVNILYRDTSVRTLLNDDGTFTIPGDAFQSPEGILNRLDQILINADYSYQHDPVDAPRIDSPL